MRKFSNLAIASPLVITGGTPTLARHPGSASTQYSFTKLATLGQSAPRGDFHINDYEPGAINNRGDIIYGTDLGTTMDGGFFGEGVFLRRAHQAELELARSTGAAPGGGTFDSLLLGAATLNDQGDGAFAFTLLPFGQPTGVNPGVYRLFHNTGNVTPVVLPGITPAPASDTFKGGGFNTLLNNKGDLLFTGIIATTKGVRVPGETYPDLGVGVFKADAQNQITSIVSPGDAAPGGGLFDFAGSSGAGGASINDAGDVAFTAHVAGEEVPFPTFPPQSQIISALGSLYFKEAKTGKITSIAHSGDPAPRGGVFREIPSTVLNNSGAIAFVGDITPEPDVNQALGVYLHLGHTTLAVARPNDPMPGGGNFCLLRFSNEYKQFGRCSLQCPPRYDSHRRYPRHWVIRMVARYGAVGRALGNRNPRRRYHKSHHYRSRHRSASAPLHIVSIYRTHQRSRAGVVRCHTERRHRGVTDCHTERSVTSKHREP